MPLDDVTRSELENELEEAINRIVGSYGVQINVRESDVLETILELMNDASH